MDWHRIEALLTENALSHFVEASEIHGTRNKYFSIWYFVKRHWKWHEKVEAWFMRYC
jgi:hypothetical protein